MVKYTKKTHPKLCLLIEDFTEHLYRWKTLQECWAKPTVCGRVGSVNKTAFFRELGQIWDEKHLGQIYVEIGMAYRREPHLCREWKDDREAANE